MPYIDELNPRLFSNNLIIPYLVGIWEDYLKSSFIVLLKYTENKDEILGNTRLSISDLNAISSELLLVEEAITDGFSVLKKSYNKRESSLYESIGHIVELRHEIVYQGVMDTCIFEKGR